MADKYYNCKIGDQVGVILYGTWRDMLFQGTYIVTKCNMNVIEIKRESDGYVRTFSNRTGAEKNAGSRSDDIVSIEHYNTQKERQDTRTLINNKWNDVASIAQKKDLDQLKKAIEELEAMQNTKLVPA